MNVVDIHTADEFTLDYLGRKSERSKLCYPFDLLKWRLSERRVSIGSLRASSPEAKRQHGLRRRER